MYRQPQYRIAVVPFVCSENDRYEVSSYHDYVWVSEGFFHTLDEATNHVELLLRGGSMYFTVDGEECDVNGFSCNPSGDL